MRLWNERPSLQKGRNLMKSVTNSNQAPSLRVLFFGTPDFSVPILRALVASEHEVVGVVTNPDRSSGRGKKRTPPPVKVVAQEASLPLFQPEKVRGNKELACQLACLEADVAVVVAYGQILPERLLNLPKYGCLNIHASLLPRFRGASPIQASLLAGDSESGVTIMKMEKGLDTGPVIEQARIPLTMSMNSETLHDALSELGAQLIVPVLVKWCSGAVIAEPQDESLSSYAPMLSKEDGKLDWGRDAQSLANHVRGMTPWPGAFTGYDLKAGAQGEEGEDGEGRDVIRVVIREAYPIDFIEESNGSNSAPSGTILEAKGDQLVVQCGEGGLAIHRIQPAGKRELTAREFINGFQPVVGQVSFVWFG